MNIKDLQFQEKTFNHATMRRLKFRILIILQRKFQLEILETEFASFYSALLDSFHLELF